jgi:hypothetical protein
MVKRELLDFVASPSGDALQAISKLLRVVRLSR